MNKAKPRAGKIVEEKKTIFPEYEEPLMNATAQQEGSQEPDEEEFSHSAMAWAEESMNDVRLKIYRVLDDGSESQVGSVPFDDLPPEAAAEFLKERFGGGKYYIRGKHPDTNITIGKGYTIEGPPKGISSAPGGVNINLNDVAKMAPENIGIVLIPHLFAQMAEMQRSQTEIITATLKAAKAGDQNAAQQQVTVKDVVEIAKLMQSQSQARWEVWVPLIKDGVKSLIEMFVPSNVDPKLAFAENVLNKIGGIVSQFAAARNANNATANRPPMPTAERVPAVAVPGQPQQPEQKSNGVDQIIQVFEQMYLPQLLKAATENLDPYALVFNFKAQMGGDTTGFFSMLGLKGPSEFFDKYEESKKYRGWFRDLFYYLMHPDATPETLDDADEEPEAEVVTQQ